jgi:hypothetical protein
LAAQLGQGDITLDQYTKQADYAYGAMIRDVLGLEVKSNEQDNGDNASDELER